jgi:hypothetical protein
MSVMPSPGTVHMPNKKTLAQLDAGTELGDSTELGER